MHSDKPLTCIDIMRSDTIATCSMGTASCRSNPEAKTSPYVLHHTCYLEKARNSKHRFVMDCFSPKLVLSDVLKTFCIVIVKIALGAI